MTHCRIIAERLSTLLIIIVMLTGVGTAQPTAEQIQRNRTGAWEIGIIQIPEENHASLIPSHYWPIERTELERRLSVLQTLDVERQFQPAVLEEAIYVAALNREALFSDHSRWKFRGYSGVKVLNVGAVSFALRDARGLPEDQTQLSNDLRFDPTGSIEVPAQPVESTRWFGFQLAALEMGKKKGYQLQLPAATIGRMFISADPELILHSDDVVIEPIDQLSDWLPQDWPQSLPAPLRSGTGNSKWWLVHLSGVSKFSLEVDYLPEGESLTWQQSLRKSELTYQVGEDSVVASAHFEIASAGAGRPLRVQLSPSLRLRSLLINGQPANWRTVSSSSDGIVLQLLGAPTLQPNTTIELQTAAKISDLLLDQDSLSLQPGEETKEFNGSSQQSSASIIRLPTIEIVRGFTMEGVTRIHGSPRNAVALIHPLPPDQTSVRKALATDSDETLHWHADWTGRAPALAAEIVRSVEQWSTVSLTRLNVQSTSVSAVSTVRLTGRNLSSNEISLPVYKDWNIESAKIIGDSGAPFRVRIDRHPMQPQQLTISWQVPSAEVEIELQVLGHTSLDALNNSPPKYVLRHAELIQPPSAQPQAFYTVEAIGDLRLSFTGELLQAVSSEREWPDSWQPPTSTRNRLVFKDSSGGHKLFSFAPVSGLYSAKSVNVVSRDPSGQWRITTLIHCEPRAGQVDRIELQFVGENAPVDWQLDFVHVGGSEIPLIPTLRESVADETNRTWEATLPYATSQPFVVRSVSSVQPLIDPMGEVIQVTLPGFPSSVETESMVFLPNQCLVTDDEAAVDLLPPGTCCHPSLADTLLSVLDHSDLGGYMAARVDGSRSHKMMLHKATQPSLSSWVWLERVEHRINEPGETTHRVYCTLQSVADNEFLMRVPLNWQLVGLAINGIPSEQYRWASNQLLIPVGHGKKTEIEAEFSSLGQPLKWFEHVSLTRPEYDTPVLERHEWVELSPRNMPVQSVILQLSGAAPKSPRDSWGQRWHVWNWWQNMHSVILESDQQSSEYPGWARLRVSRERSESEPVFRFGIVNRNVTLSLMYAIIFLLSGLAWFSIRLAPRMGLMFLVTALVLHACAAEHFVFFSQLVLFSFAIGSSAWLIERIKLRTDVDPKRPPRSASGFSRAAMWLSLFILQPALAQDADTVGSTVNSESLVYGVIVPSDEQNRPSGDYVYIPQSLRDKLYAADGTGPGSESPRVLSASYLLRFRQNPRDAEAIQECSVELRILVSDTQSEILLPFRGEELKWISTPLLNGQPRILDGRNFRLDPQGAGIYFRGEAVGISNVTLQFKPLIREIQDRRYALDVSVPIVPNSTLRLSPSGLVSNLKVESRGLVQRSFLGDTVAHLGPVDRLQITWTESDRTPLPVSTEQTTQTWLSLKDTQIVAAAMLKIEQSRGLGREVDLIMDSNWVPIGTVWGDAELISSQSGSGFRRRTILRVRLADSNKPEYMIRMLMVPRDVSEFDVLEVPFLSLDRVNTRARYFWVSSSQNSQWSTEISDSRPWQDENLVEWEPYILAPQRTGYQLFGSNAQLRRESNERRIDSYTETTVMRIQHDRTTINYETQWEPGGSAPETLWLRLPRATLNTRVEVNGVPIQQSHRAGHRLMVSLKDNGISRINRLKVDVDLPPSAAKITQLPRIQIEDRLPRKSVYQLYRGASVYLDVKSGGSGLDFLPPLATQNWSQAVERLESLVGEADLPSELLSDRRLETSIEIRPVDSAKPARFVTYLDQANDGWVARVESIWKAQTCEQDFAFFEVPFVVRDNLIGSSLPCRFLPHADSTKINLCMPIAPADAQGWRRVEFSFRLGALPATQGLSIPAVSQLDQSARPVVALPKSVDELPVRWRHRGETLDAAFLEQAEPVEDSKYYFVVSPKAHLQVSWQTVDASRKKAGSSTVWVEITSQSDKEMAGTINYWCHPMGQVTQQFTTPDHFEVLGIECGHQNAIWSHTKNGLFVTLQPNYLPIQIRITGRWKASPDGKVLLQLPTAEGWDQPNSFFLTQHAESRWIASDNTPMTIEAQRHGLLDRWTELISSIAPSLPGLPVAESSNWLNDWHPDRLGFQNDWMLSRTSLRDSSITYDLNGNGDITVAEFWSGIAALADLFELEDLLTARESPLLSDTTTWAIDASQVEFDRREPPQSTGTIHWGFGLAMWSVAGLLLLTFGWATQPLTSFLDRSWLDWLILALIAGVVLPTIWPAIAIALIGGGLQISHFVEHRRRMRRFST